MFPLVLSSSCLAKSCSGSKPLVLSSGWGYPRWCPLAGGLLLVLSRGGGRGYPRQVQRVPPPKTRLGLINSCGDVGELSFLACLVSFKWKGKRLTSTEIRVASECSSNSIKEVRLRIRYDVVTVSKFTVCGCGFNFLETITVAKLSQVINLKIHGIKRVQNQILRYIL